MTETLKLVREITVQAAKPRLSKDDSVWDEHFGQIIIGVRTLANCRDLFDRGAQRELAFELRAAAARLSPPVRRLMRSQRRDYDGAELFRLVAS